MTHDAISLPLIFRYAANDPGCKSFVDEGQTTHCIRTCNTCPPPSESPEVAALESAFDVSCSVIPDLEDTGANITQVGWFVIVCWPAD